MLAKFLGHLQIEYLLVSEDFRIVDMSSGVARYAEDERQVILGEDVRGGFPELVGLESQMLSIAKGDSEAFELKGICRRSNYQNPLYVDLYIACYQELKTFWLKASNREFDEETPVTTILLKDATERMALEQRLGQIAKETMLLANALDDYQKYLSNILTYMSDALFVCDRFGTIKMANRSLQNLLQYSESELIDQPISTIFPNPQLYPQNQVLYFRKTELFQNIAVTCQTKTGLFVSLLVSASVIFYDEPEASYYIYLARQNPADSYQKYINSILQHINAGLLVCDRDDTIKMVNQKLKQLLGYSEVDLIQQPIDILIPDTSLHPRNYTNYRHTSELFNNVTCICKAKDDGSLSMSISASIIYYDHQEVPRYVYLLQPTSSNHRESAAE
ncbi:PAS domain S-box protein [Geitlerinema sp. PCC 9228]|jgi:PAS domain S-box-containing protein|uniref:PAS domain-containing protein n=1 Tax=Geitlerinema sp. PCC 9228 TaxID=111611 RepID=UPI0008F9C29A|nr:PAS domain S-box protein [Geitlerinema sp. PCC 9228]